MVFSQGIFSFILLFGGTIAQRNCVPEVFYVVRHAERYTGKDDAHFLTSEGFQRTFDLRDHFLENDYPIERVVVPITNRDLLTVTPIIEEGAIVTSFVQTTQANADTISVIESLNPCPQHLIIDYQNDWIGNLIRDLGFDESGMNLGWSDQDVFDEMYILENNENKTLIVDHYGGTTRRGNRHVTSDFVFPSGFPVSNFSGDFCEPEILYVLIAPPELRIDDEYDSPLTQEGFERSHELAQYFADTQLPLSHIFYFDKTSAFLTIAALEATVQIEMERYTFDTRFSMLQETIAPHIEDCPTHALVVIPEGTETDLFDVYDFEFNGDRLVNGFWELDLGTRAVSRHLFSEEPLIGDFVDCASLGICDCHLRCEGWGWSTSSRACVEGRETSTREKRQGGCREMK